MFLNSFRFENGAEVRVITAENGDTHVIMPNGTLSRGPGGDGYDHAQLLCLLNMISNASYEQLAGG